MDDNGNSYEYDNDRNNGELLLPYSCHCHHCLCPGRSVLRAQNVSSMQGERRDPAYNQITVWLDVQYIYIYIYTYVHIYYIYTYISCINISITIINFHYYDNF